MTNKKSVVEQIIEFVKTNADAMNAETFSTFEFVVQGGKLDGCRIKRYIKADKKNKNDKNFIST